MDKIKGNSEILKSFAKEQKDVFNRSTQPMYAFLDEDSRLCNGKFAKLLGYANAEEWESVDVNGSFPDTFVEKKSHNALVSAYQTAMEQMAASTIRVTWKTKSGSPIDTTVILVPVLHRGVPLALHFLT